MGASMRNMTKKLLWLTFYSLPVVAFAANFTEPRAQSATVSSAPSFSQPVKVIIHKSRVPFGGTLASVSADSGQAPHTMSTAQQVKAYIQRQALEHGVSP